MMIETRESRERYDYRVELRRRQDAMERVERNAPAFALAASLDHDAHVRTRHLWFAERALEEVGFSVAIQRALSGATGAPSEIVVRPHIVERVLLDDPMMTDAELVYQRARKPGDPRVGKAYVTRNLFEVIGGLVYIRRRLRHQEKAAEWYRIGYQAAFGSFGGVDLEAVRVDRSIIAHDAGMANRVDDRRDMHALVTSFGGPLSDPVRLLTAVVVAGCSVTDIAGKASRARERVTQALLDALDKVAVKRGYVMERR